MAQTLIGTTTTASARLWLLSHESRTVRSVRMERSFMTTPASHRELAQSSSPSHAERSHYDEDLSGPNIMASLKKTVKHVVLQTPCGRILLMPFRLSKALSYYAPKLKYMLRWTLSSREVTNFTYQITRANQEYLAHTVSVITGVPYSGAMSYLAEIQEDDDVRRHIAERVRRSPGRHVSDEVCVFGRRIGWYAFVRIVKPRVVVETGVDKGHGAVLLCAALMRNEAE